MARLDTYDAQTASMVEQQYLAELSTSAAFKWFLQRAALFQTRAMHAAVGPNVTDRSYAAGVAQGRADILGLVSREAERVSNDLKELADGDV